MSFLPVQRALDPAIQSNFLDTSAKKMIAAGVVLTALHVASALIAVAAAGLRGLYKNLPHEYAPATPRHRALQDLAGYLKFSQVTNKIISLFKTSKKLQICAVSWNLSGVNDLRLALMGNRAKGDETTDATRRARYKSASIAHLTKIIHGFGPDIILMQGLAGSTNPERNEHTPLLNLLKEKGYRIYTPGKDTAIAFKETVFLPERISNFEKDVATIDLRHKATGKKIRAVSDYIVGFHSQAFRTGDINTKKSLTENGDNHAKRMVDHLTKETEDFLVVYGVNSNTTSPYQLSADAVLHPNRLKCFTDCDPSFIRDQDLVKDLEHSTVIDPNCAKSEKERIKVDHILCWHPKKQIMVARQIIDNINGPQLLQPEHLFTTKGTGSIHLPVAAIITLPKEI